jgi:multidrug efflux pump
MNISEPFIRKPVATTLLVVAITLAGSAAYRLLPVSPLPSGVPDHLRQRALPGASPETIASSVATPLERQFGHIAAVNEMSSSSALASTSVTLQFDLDRDIDAAARDVQAAINAARGYLPASLPNNPTYRKVNPSDSPIFMLALTSPVLTRAQVYDAASTIMAQKLSQVSGVGQVTVGGSSLPAVRVELNPTALNKFGIGLEQVGPCSARERQHPEGTRVRWPTVAEVGANDQILAASDCAPLVVAYSGGSAVRISDVGRALDSEEDLRNSGYANGKPSVW